jgi:hypothetical protein
MRGTAGAGRLFWVLLALPHILIVSRPVIFAGCTVIVQVCQIRAFLREEMDRDHDNVEILHISTNSTY